MESTNEKLEELKRKRDQLRYAGLVFEEVPNLTNEERQELRNKGLRCQQGRSFWETTGVFGTSTH